MTRQPEIDYKKIYDSSADMCLSLNPVTGKIIECNQTLLNVLGYTKSEILKASLFDLYHHEEAEKVKDNYQAIKTQRTPKNKEFVVRKKNGDLVDVTLKLTFVEDDKGNVLYTNAIWRDISEIKLARKALILEKEKVEALNKNFVDATNYAKRIQTAILPSTRTIESLLPNSFVYYQPKGIVSGDFFWTHQVENKLLFSVFDSTGHGVPGGFLSMIGTSILNQIILKEGEIYPCQILTQMRTNIVNYLNSDKNSTSDGMDGALCAFDKESKVVTFSGANNPLLLIRKGTREVYGPSGNLLDIQPKFEKEDYFLFEFKGDSQPIGYYFCKGVPFKSASIQLQKGDRLYLYSDGFQDQFGGLKSKKYLRKNFQKFLLNISDQNISNQKESLYKEHHVWRGTKNEQTDDICIMGVEIS